MEIEARQYTIEQMIANQKQGQNSHMAYRERSRKPHGNLRQAKSASRIQRGGGPAEPAPAMIGANPSELTPSMGGKPRAHRTNQNASQPGTDC
ncbi:hypothetical protein R1flu_011237 [Riccia fluitans]|uniref:Uncharacterized protein n=1 Tax=Riccia fluitans TaxID=41844 RepID=A0ABD1Z791_9MARC